MSVIQVLGNMDFFTLASEKTSRKPLESWAVIRVFSPRILNPIGLIHLPIAQRKYLTLLRFYAVPRPQKKRTKANLQLFFMPIIWSCNQCIGVVSSHLQGQSSGALDYLHCL